MEGTQRIAGGIVDPYMRGTFPHCEGLMSDTPHVYPTTAALIAQEAPDFPSFLFSERELHRSVKVFRKGFDGLLTYAVKCNPSPHVLRQLHNEGLKAFDVASH